MPAITKPMFGRSGSGSLGPADRSGGGGSDGSAFRLALGDYIRDLRTRRGMTQDDLARAVRMKRATSISAIEVGRNTVPPERYLDFARVLGVNPKTFMRRVLQLTNPWAFALLFEADPETAFQNVNAQLNSRVSEPGPDLP